jgi:hypothetical protein
MKRTFTLAAAALALLPAVAAAGGAVAQAAPPPTRTPQVFVTTFDNPNEKLAWTADGDATTSQHLEIANGDDACNTMRMSGAYAVLSSYDPTTHREAGGQTRNEVPDPVATWAQANFPASGSSETADRYVVDVVVTWSARNVRRCEDCTVGIFVGDQAPAHGGDFDMVGALGRGWQQYRYQTRLELTNGARLFVATGWMGGEATIGLDCITVKVVPVQSAEADRPAPPQQPSTARTTGNYFYNFENGLAPWGFGGEGSFGLLEQEKGSNGCSDVAGQTYASLKSITGATESTDLLDLTLIPAPIGTSMHMIAPFRPARGQVSHVELDWAARSVSECGNCTQLVYVGTNEYPRATEFKRLTSRFEHQWANNHFEADVQAAASAMLYVGLGWQGPQDDSPEVPRNVGIDCLSVRIQQPNN